MVFEAAVIQIHPFQEIRIFRSGNLVESISLVPRIHIKENLRLYSEYVTGRSSQILGTLLDCRPIVHLNALAYVSAGRILEVPTSLAKRFNGADATTSGWRILEIETLLRRFVETGDFSELRDLSGDPRQPDRALPEDLGRLASTVDSMCRAACVEEPA